MCGLPIDLITFVTMRLNVWRVLISKRMSKLSEVSELITCPNREMPWQQRQVRKEKIPVCCYPEDYRPSVLLSQDDWLTDVLSCHWMSDSTPFLTPQLYRVLSNDSLSWQAKWTNCMKTARWRKRNSIEKFKSSGDFSNEYINILGTVEGLTRGCSVVESQSISLFVSGAQQAVS